MKQVYFCSARQSRLIAEETLPKKLELILEKLRISERVKNETVAIKMHLGGNVGYSTIHPVFVRKVVEAVLDGGGRPFITDVSSSCLTAYKRGYTQETLGCPIYPNGGPDEKYFYKYEKNYKSISEWLVGGMMHDASFLIDLSHIKGHPSCGFGGAMKNLALGGMMGKTRSSLHDVVHFDKYWFPENCPDTNKVKEIINSCPFGGIGPDRDDPTKIYLHLENCNQCYRCLEVAPKNSLKIEQENFASFQEACAISASLILSTFEKGKSTFINIANQITPLCDCFGFTSLNILPDIGIFGSDDIIAVDTAVLDAIRKYNVIKEDLPSSLEFQPEAGHPFQQIHGPLKNPYLMIEYGQKTGLGEMEYELIDLMPNQAIQFGERPIHHVSAK
jgi:uncharacterized protein